MQARNKIRLGTRWGHGVHLVMVFMVLSAEAAWAQTLPKNRRATIEPSVIKIAPGAEQRFKIILSATRLMAAHVPKEVK